MTSPAVAHRQRIERNIVTLIVESALDKGYQITIDNGEIALRRSRDAVEILDEIMATDEETLIFHKTDKFGPYGFVFLVYGNDGWDVIADYTDNEETRAILSPAEKYADTAEDQALA